LVFVTLARGVALFIVLYTVLSFFALATGSPHNQTLWWIDLSGIPSPLWLLLQVANIVALAVFVVRVPRGIFVRYVCAALAAAFALVALSNAASVYVAAAAGSITLGAPLPFSLFVMVVYIWITAAIILGRRYHEARAHRRLASLVLAGAALVVAVVLMPVGQIFCFGLTEYHTPVDAAVVFGAQVLPNGQPSDALRARLDKAVALYDEGRASVLIMSGGIDIGGTDEAEAMRDYAVSRGVDPNSILTDNGGATTEDTVTDTLTICHEEGYDRIAAVSSFYHLARIKMLYLDHGHDVVTVPAAADLLAPSTISAALREIPGWWYYWLTDL
jgi:vancomycin permeability regulator SanA